MRSPEVIPVSSGQFTGGKKLFQSPFWGAFKARFGWRQVFLTYQFPDTKEVIGQLLLLLRPLVPGRWLGYVPYGPEESNLPGPKGESLSLLAQAIDAVIPETMVLLRYDLDWEACGVDPLDLTRTRGPDSRFSGDLRKARADIQPPATVVLDCTQTEDAIMQGMKSKTRYNVRLARRKGITVREAAWEEIEQWYDLYRATAERDRIAIHSREYYRDFLELAHTFEGVRPQVHLLFAEHDDQLLAGIIAAGYKDTVYYLYGASSNQKRNCMPTYLLQWEAIRWAKQNGYTWYDLFGIPPVEDPDHPMHGLYRFKTGFGGRVVRYCGCWDAPVRPIEYAVYRQAEAVREYYYKTLKKR